MGRCGSLWVVVGRCGIVVDRCGSLWVVVGRCGSFRVLVFTMIQYTFRIEANEREFTSHLVDFEATSVFTSPNQMLYIVVSTLTPDDRKVKT